MPEPAAVRGAVYDFTTGAGVDRFAYGNAIPQTPIPPGTNSVPSTAFNSADYTAVSVSDDSRHTTGVIEGGEVAAVRFVFSIVEPPATITQIDILWEGGADQDAPQTVRVWNAGADSYALAGSRLGAVPPDGTVTHLTIRDGSTWDVLGVGGGMTYGYGTAVLTDCTFNNNQADERAGGMTELFGDSTLTNCRFFDNSTFVGGLQHSTGGGTYVHQFDGMVLRSPDK